MPIETIDSGTVTPFPDKLDGEGLRNDHCGVLFFSDKHLAILSTIDG